MSIRSTTNHFIPFLFLSVGVYLSAMPLASAQNSLIDRMQKAKNSIVTIEAQKMDSDKTLTSNKMTMLERSGAGVIIHPTGYIVTNTHTILNAQFIFVTLHDGTRLSASIASIAPDSDFTILKISPPSALQALPWADSQTAHLDDEVISIGNSTLWKETISGGRINSIGHPQSGKSQTVELLGMDLNLDHGDSGGPILDHNGSFLGIVVAKNTHMDRTSYAIPSNKIREHFLNHIKENDR